MECKVCRYIVTQIPQRGILSPDHSNASWKVHLDIDGVNVGYSLALRRCSSDGFWRARFEGTRADQSMSAIHQLMFETPKPGVEGDYGVIRCELKKGHYDTRVHLKRERDQFATLCREISCIYHGERRRLLLKLPKSNIFDEAQVEPVEA